MATIPAPPHGRRRVQGRRFETGRVLYMATAAKHSPVSALDQRLVGAGKLPRSPWSPACAKPLTTLNAMVRSNKPWDRSLHHVLLEGHGCERAARGTGSTMQTHVLAATDAHAQLQTLEPVQAPNSLAVDLLALPASSTAILR